MSRGSVPRKERPEAVKFRAQVGPSQGSVSRLSKLVRNVPLLTSFELSPFLVLLDFVLVGRARADCRNTRACSYNVGGIRAYLLDAFHVMTACSTLLLLRENECTFFTVCLGFGISGAMPVSSDLPDPDLKIGGFQPRVKMRGSANCWELS